MRYVWYVLIMVSALVSASPALSSDLMRDLFGCTSNARCVIKHSPGGDVHSFELAAEEARVIGTQVVIDGPCESACVIFASVIRTQACITRRARMRIHMGTRSWVYDSTGHELDEAVSDALTYHLPPDFTIRYRAFVPDYGTDIVEWATKEKKLNDDPAVFTTLTRREALRFWKACT